MNTRTLTSACPHKTPPARPTTPRPSAFTPPFCSVPPPDPRPPDAPSAPPTPSHPNLPVTSPPPPLPPLIPQLPSRRVGAILAALMLAAGIVLGALIGPGPASLAGTSRAATLGRVLALLALGGGPGSELLSSGAAYPPAASSQPSPAPSPAAAVEARDGSGAAGRGVRSSPSASPTY